MNDKQRKMQSAAIDDDIELLEGFLRQNFPPGRAIGIMACTVAKLIVEQSSDIKSFQVGQRSAHELIDVNIKHMLGN